MFNALKDRQWLTVTATKPENFGKRKPRYRYIRDESRDFHFRPDRFSWLDVPDISPERRDVAVFEGIYFPQSAGCVHEAARVAIVLYDRNRFSGSKSSLISISVFPWEEWKKKFKKKPDIGRLPDFSAND